MTYVVINSKSKRTISLLKLLCKELELNYKAFNESDLETLSKLRKHMSQNISKQSKKSSQANK
jgi:hypothetical protein